jgi:hypothetical protein
MAWHYNDIHFISVAQVSHIIFFWARFKWLCRQLPRFYHKSGRHHSFADVFALSVSKVKQVEGAVHRLNIEPDTKFSTKVHQKPLMPPQCRYLHEKLQAMLDTGIIEPCEPGQVKCVSPTTLAQKTHEGAGLTLDELQHRINEECMHNGLEPQFDLPPRTKTQAEANSAKDKDKEPKWRICQKFSQINKVMQVAPMPQGDIRESNNDLVATDGYPYSISQGDSTQCLWTQNHDPIPH